MADLRRRFHAAGRRRRALPLALVAAGGFFGAILLGLALPYAPQLLTRLQYQAIRVIDGDTIRLASGERVRLLNIDAPEMPPNARCRAEEALALASRDRLRQMIRGASDISLRFGGDRDHDVYGRSLRYLVIDGRDAGEVLIADGLAQPWRGRHATWC